MKEFRSEVFRKGLRIPQTFSNGDNQRRINRIWAFDPFHLDSAKRVLLRGGEPVSLQPKAMEILLVLIQRQGEVVSKDQLMQAVWGDAFVEESNLSQSIFVLRKALGERASENRYIATIPGRGYTFVAMVKEVSECIEDATETTIVKSDESRNASHTSTYLTPGAKWAIAASILAMALILAMVSSSPKSARSTDVKFAMSVSAERSAPSPVVVSTDPLIQALRKGDLNEAQKLVHSGAKLNVVDNYGDTPLLQAIRGGYTDFAEELLSSGADPKFPDGSSSVLVTAAHFCDLRIVRKLVDQGISVNAWDVRGDTALMSASWQCPDGKMVRFLLDKGADPNAKDRDGFTALMWAATSGNRIAAEKLLKAGTDPTPKDNRGETAEEECENFSGKGSLGKGHADVCALFENAKAETSGQ